MQTRQSEKKSVKVQITLPEDIVQKIEEDIKESYSSKSFWFLKIINEHYEQKEKKKKNFISLNIQ
jgi:metal-responsive CopG/Arc/MetJ family transcriptional regulator